MLDVDEATINRWKLEHSDFCESIKRGKNQADARVAASLYERAVGCSHVAEKIYPASKDQDVQRIEFTEHYPPDTTAAIFWLKNRQPKLWRDMHRMEHSGPDGEAIAVGGMDGETLARFRQVAQQELVQSSKSKVQSREAA